MSISKLLLPAVAGLVLAACQGPTGESAMISIHAPPPAPGFARVYFYRDAEPYESLARPQVYLNAVAAEISEPGGVSFRDLPPGDYHISVDSPGLFPHQSKDLVLRPGDVRYVKIESLESWNSGAGRRRLWSRDTFIVELIPEAQAQSEIGQMRAIPAS